MEVDLNSPDRDCRRCYFSQVPAVHDRFFIEAVRPYIWFAAVCLFLSYVFGLLFTLRTHAAVIWANEVDEKKIEKMENSAAHLSSSGHSEPRGSLTRQFSAGPSGSTPRKDIRDSELYKRILGQSLKQAGLAHEGSNGSIDKRNPHRGGDAATPHLVPPRGGTSRDFSGDDRSQRSFPIPGLSEDEHQSLVRQVAEMAATAAAVATRDATRAPHKMSQMAATEASKDTSHPPHHERHPVFVEDGAESTSAEAGHAEVGGHDAPNWSRTKSAVILLTATLAYAIIAEILVNTVDTVLDNIDIDEKFLGITLFALVPNTTEFLVGFSHLCQIVITDFLRMLSRSL